eukprot:CAMPEP_0198210456 /NCGR_PEP_ID=MMETSP1445-20131203/20119_1 /TAXON_ID=36898 /ORGANISM="Pyramimonas sp., Strain CCMP2087" /LENGTH=123 /DNA_ID=CAMNT_0043884521 /DNA_START=123 /DNA_END=494 /DNA_ORIENTATION=-
MVASVQFMITNQNKKKLADLGYPAEEIETMEPTLAMSVISRNMIRPWGSKPMPENWKRKGYQKVLEKRGGGGGGGMGVFFVGAALVGLFFALPRLKEARQKLFWKRESLSHYRGAANSNTRHR